MSSSRRRSSRRRGDGILLLLGSAAMAMSVAAAVLEYRRRRRRHLRRGHPSGEVGSLLNMAAEVTLLRPGIVLIKRALPAEAQKRVLEYVLATGHGQRRWWCRVRRDRASSAPRDGKAEQETAP